MKKDTTNIFDCMKIGWMLKVVGHLKHFVENLKEHCHPIGLGKQLYIKLCCLAIGLPQQTIAIDRRLGKQLQTN